MLEKQIRNALVSGCAPAYLEVLNESSGHNVPAGSQTHFKVVLVSDRFEGLGRLQRHRHVYALLQQEMANGVHALSVHAYTPLEWAARNGAVTASAPCAGGDRLRQTGHKS